MAAARQNSRNRLTLSGIAWPAALLCLALANVAAADATPSERLQDALARYERIAATGGWPTTPDGPTIEPGSADSRIQVVAQRLAVSGDLAATQPAFETYDETLQAAVLRFQARHGLEQDALIGKQTLRALNVPATKRVEQLRLNIARASHIFETPHDDFLLVNVPAFKVTLFRDGKALSMARVIVGETGMQTPLFQAELKHVVLNPTWTVPRNIATEELLPRIQVDRGYLTRNAYDVVGRDGTRLDPASVEWESLGRNNFPYTLVQRAGPLNELGRIKFLFPNEYGVCMHDTPKKFLFERDSRAFSHGCVRVEDPLDFAAHVLGPEGWTSERIAAQLGTNETHTIVLSEPLPIVLVYLTAEADDDGTVFFYRDVYGMDAG